jgi:predicted SnoaL-like aldol condensation-catalyzing enzyme
VTGFDVFRVRDGRMVEHWDAGQPARLPTASGRGALDGPTSIVDRDRTAENKALVERFSREVLVGRDLSALDAFFDAGRLAQHDPRLPDGVAALRADLAGGPPRRHTEVRRVIGEGNWVLVQALGRLEGAPAVLYDLYRVQSGRIAEHWCVSERIPPRPANANGML